MFPSFPDRSLGFGGVQGLAFGFRSVWAQEFSVPGAQGLVVWGLAFRI